MRRFLPLLLPRTLVFTISNLWDPPVSTESEIHVLQVANVLSSPFWTHVDKHPSIENQTTWLDLLKYYHINNHILVLLAEPYRLSLFLLPFQEGEWVRDEHTRRNVHGNFSDLSIFTNSFLLSNRQRWACSCMICKS